MSATTQGDGPGRGTGCGISVAGALLVVIGSAADGTVWVILIGVALMGLGVFAFIGARIARAADTQEAKAADAPNSPKRPASPARPLPEGWPAAGPTKLTVFELWGQRGWADQEVEGESYRRAGIAKVFKALGGRSGEDVAAEAVLIPEPDNGYDRNAVRVEIRGEHVGYLPRADAEVYAPVLQRLVIDGFAPVTGARLWALKDGDTWRARVTLDLAPVTELCPANQAPAGPFALLPRGSTLQVAGEDEHMDALAPYLPADRKPVWLTLVVERVHGARSSRETIAVHLDGDRIGGLSPAKSKELLPLAQAAATAGVTLAARGMVSGNTLRADVTLTIAKASDISQAWIDAELAHG